MLDMHMHSRYSDDGELTPAELMARCRAAGVDFMAITDHNTIAALPEAAVAARNLGLGYVPAVELDCVHKGREYHVLAYGVKDAQGEFARLEAGIRAQSRDFSFESLEKTREMGFDVCVEEMRHVSRNCSWEDDWTGEMFAEVLLNRPDYQNDARLMPYRPGGARSDNPYVNFYWDFYSQGKPGYVPRAYPSMEDVLEIIHGDGALAVLAHPEANLKGRMDVFEELMLLPIDGVEAFSSYHSVEQAAQYCRAARAHRKLLTCGSDYHGRLKPAIHLGQMSFPPELVRAEIEKEIRKRMEKLAI